MPTPSNRLPTSSNGLPMPISGQSVFSTPHSQPGPGATKRRLPVITEVAFNAQHTAGDKQIRRYHATGRKGSIRLTRDVVTELDPSHAKYLAANNLDARLNFARITAEHLAAAVETLADDQPVFFVTLIRHDHTIREDQAAGFNIKRSHAWAYRVLRECAYVGMCEGSLYTNLNAAGASFKRAVSWHIHAVVWGIAEADLAKICDAANARYRTIIDGIQSAHHRRLSVNEVAGRALYMCKGQLSEYRVWPRKRTSINSETGEITIEGTGRFRQGKRPLRPGDMARMYNLFAGRLLDKLAFSGGAGKPVLKAIRHEALADFRSSERRKATQLSTRKATACQQVRSRPSLRR